MVGTGEALVSSDQLYSTAVPVSLAAHTSPEASTVRPPGPFMPLVMTAGGRTSPVAPGRYKVMEPGPVPREPRAFAQALATKIGPATRPAAGCPVVAADAGREVPRA
jgi:hypothetical protein